MEKKCVVNRDSNGNVSSVSVENLDYTNYLKIREDVNLSSQFGDNYTSIDDLISRGYSVSPVLVELAKKFGTKIYVVNDELYDKSKNILDTYVDDLINDDVYQNAINSGKYTKEDIENIIRSNVLPNITPEYGEAKGNSIYIKDDYRDYENHLGNRGLEHELAHVFTAYYLSNAAQNSTNLNNEEKEFRNTILGAYKQSLENPNKTDAYGYTSPDEFLAEYISNDAFREEVENYLNPEQKEKSFFEKISDFIRKLFGVTTNDEIRTIYNVKSAIDAHLAKLLKANGQIELSSLYTNPLAIEQAQDIKLSYDNNGNILAPNGNISNLSELNAKIVRTKSFKDWFGDWENNPKSASKVVDENGEPLVVYTGNYVNAMSGDIKFSTPSKNYAEGYSRGVMVTPGYEKYFANLPKSEIIAGFLNIKNIQKFDEIDTNTVEDYIVKNPTNNIDGFTGIDRGTTFTSYAILDVNQMLITDFINSDVGTRPNEFIPSQLYDQLKQQPFIDSDQALELYKNIYTKDLNYWKTTELNCK